MLFCEFYDLFINSFIDCGYRGKTYKSRESFPKGDKCNTSICFITLDVRCTEMSCVDKYIPKKTQPFITEKQPNMSYDSKY